MNTNKLLDATKQASRKRDKVQIQNNGENYKDHSKN